jgi:ribonucleoside-diphosphate reductase alpha chain
MNTPIWYNDLSHEFMRDYLQGQSIQERIDVITGTFYKYLAAELPQDAAAKYAHEFKDYLYKGYISLSSPVWSNYGTDKGTPISCFGSNIEDSIESLTAAQAEITMMSKLGGGTSAVIDMRPKGSSISVGGAANGPLYYLPLLQTNINRITQGSTRRGSLAVYMDVSHPEILEFLKMRSPGHELQDLSFGVCIPEGWMQAMIDGDKPKRQIWAEILKTRANTGFPYIEFLDNANNNAADVYKYNPKYRITHSNLCNEIQLPDSQDESFVCCLSSLNIYHYDEWKDTNLVGVVTYFLDTVLTDFIKKADNIKFMDRAVRFADRHRAIGIGQLGFHSYLQSKGIPYESLQAKIFNSKVSKQIYTQAYKASEDLANSFGACEVSIELSDIRPDHKPRRNATLVAIAPTKSSAFILGQVSESVEPIHSNFFIDGKAKARISMKNRELERLIGTDDTAIWDSILKNRGSVQHLGILSPEQKDVFKTFAEISQGDVLVMAAQRQKYIDQGQSLNVMIHPSAPAKAISELYIDAWRNGIKGLYYSKGLSAALEFSLKLMQCSSCEA